MSMYICMCDCYIYIYVYILATPYICRDTHAHHHNPFNTGGHVISNHQELTSINDERLAINLSMISCVLGNFC